MLGILINFLSIIGLYALIFYLYDNLKTPTLLFIWEIKQFLFGIDSIENLKKKYGDWAAITGSTDGIGKVYARELARRGFNVVLISRNEEKLRKVAEEIVFDFSVETKIIVADFSNAKEACKHVEKELAKLPVRILINNVGQNTSEPGPIACFTDEEIWNVISTNIGPLTLLSRFFIKHLRDAKKTGLIVNVSSCTENFPVANGATYAATKAYNRSLTLALQEEARPHGIDVHLLSPYFVVTKINSYSEFIMRGNVLIPDVHTYTKSAVQRLGKVDATTGYIWHDVQHALITAWPSRLRNYITNFVGRIVLSHSKVRS